jgi:hypothetical protein
MQADGAHQMLRNVLAPHLHASHSNSRALANLGDLQQILTRASVYLMPLEQVGSYSGRSMYPSHQSK